MTKDYFPKWSKWIFLVLFAAQCLAYHYNHIFGLRPQSVHTWRQTDGLVVAQNYYEEDRGFFNPAMNHVMKTGRRNAVSEFPLIQYLVAKLWKVFGVHEWMYRAIVFLFFLGGLMVFMKATEEEIRNSVWPILITMLLFSSTTLAFYANNFLPDIPALGCVLAGAGLLFRYRHNGRFGYFLSALLLFVLGSLFKISFAMVPLAFFGLWVIQLLFSPGLFFHHARKEGLAFILYMVVVVLWVSWVKMYNSDSSQGIFLTSAKPLWELKSAKDLRESLRELFTWPFYELFSGPVWTFLMLVFVALLANFKRADKPLFIVTLLMFLGSLSYAVLFYQNLPVHDYYYIIFIGFFAITLLTGLKYLKTNHEGVLSKVWLKVVFFIVVGTNVWLVSAKMEARYFERDYSFLINRSQKEKAAYSLFMHSIELRAFENITPYLRSLGIEREDRVICMQDPSPNVTLYLTGQIGWTSFGLSGTERDQTYISDRIRSGAKYLLLNAEDIKQRDYVQPFVGHKIGQFGNIEIFDLRSYKL